MKQYTYGGTDLDKSGQPVAQHCGGCDGGSPSWEGGGCCGVHFFSEADAQALADVRTLDEYVESLPFEASWECTRYLDGWDVVFTDGNRDELPPEPMCEGPTPDAARHVAAEWVRKEQGK